MPGIVNTWDQLVAAGGGVAVSYQPYSRQSPSGSPCVCMGCQQRRQGSTNMLLRTKSCGPYCASAQRNDLRP